MKKSAIKIVEINKEEMEACLERAKEKLDKADYEKFKLLYEATVQLLSIVQDKNTSISRLQKMIFGASTESSSNVLNKINADSDNKQAAENNSADGKTTKEKKPRKGHGRNGVKAYTGAKTVVVAHEELKSGDSCPECPKGKVYKVEEPTTLVRITGQAPIQATIYELEKLRCNLCGTVFTAKEPPGISQEKYDESAISMNALLKYGTGLPFYRLAKLQESFGIPLPYATQWENVEKGAVLVEPIFDELIKQAAQGDVLHNDDTTMKILEIMKNNKKTAAAKTDGSKERTGIFTSGIVSIKDEHKIILFFTGRNHAGENLGDVLKNRAKDLGPPIQMCDALSRNLPEEVKVILANCNCHARRRFVDVVNDFPEEVRYVLDIFIKIYKNDAYAKEQKMSTLERLIYHQTHSGPVMQEFHTWLTAQFEEKIVEPNSGLGEAISYMLKHWNKLTCFLQTAGAPIDNNICERALKLAILHRKNSMFYQTQNGADVGDIYMSIIYTAKSAGANPFDYLNELQRNSQKIKEHPEQWMPWNYRETLACANQK